MSDVYKTGVDNNRSKSDFSR